jgi:parvulin-like peptidyl-prolyl isomerase
MRIFLLSLLAAAVWAQPGPAPAKPAKPAQAAKPAAARPAAPKAAPAKAATPAKPAVPASPVVLTIGAESMTQADFESLVAALPANVQQDVQAEGGKRRLAERIVEIRTLAQEARRRGIDGRQAVQQQIRLNQDNLLASLLYQDLLAAAKPSAEDLAKYYEEHKKEYDQASARHILIRFKGSRVPLKPDQKDLTEEEALAKTEELRKRIAGGEDFAAVAKAESDDTGSGAQGGDLGSFGRGQMVQVFDDAVFTQPVGEISQPVKSQFGYHLIQVQSRTSKTLDDVKAEIEQALAPDGAQKAINEIKSASKSSLVDSYFGPPAAPAPAPAEAK